MQIPYSSITHLIRNKAAVFTLRNPREQSGQEHICSIYKSIAKLVKICDKIMAVWLPSNEDDALWTCAKEKAKEATRQGKEPQSTYHLTTQEAQLVFIIARHRPVCM